jgi:hypothetical protein
MIGLLFSIIAGILLADFVTGVVHWLEDRFGSEAWPLLGPLVIAPNRLHHREPLAFTRAGFLSRNSTAAAGALAIGAAALLVFGPSLVLGVAIGAGCLANEVHLWAHRPDRAPRIVRMLQATGLLQSRRHHSVHHAAPHDRRYCTLTSWLNPLLDRAGFWRLLEAPIPTRWFA